MYNSVAASIVMRLHIYHYISFRMFPLLQKETSYLLAVLPRLSVPPALGKHMLLNLYAVAMLDTSYKWNLSLSLLWCLASFTCHRAFTVHLH